MNFGSVRMNIENEILNRKIKRNIPLHNLSDTESAQSYWALADGFSTAADQLLSNPPGQKILTPILYLLGHSLELHFKSYLILQGVSEKKLSKDIGHNLVNCLRLCNQLGLYKHLSLTYSQTRQIVRVNRYYQGKQLEYFYSTAKQFGVIENFRNIVSQTSKAVFSPITEINFRLLSKK